MAPMRIYFAFFGSLLLVSACSGSIENSISTGIAQTLQISQLETQVALGKEAIAIAEGNTAQPISPQSTSAPPTQAPIADDSTTVPSLPTFTITTSQTFTSTASPTFTPTATSTSTSTSIPDPGSRYCHANHEKLK